MTGLRPPQEFFCEPDRIQIEQAVRLAEQTTSAEIRVHVGRLSWGIPLVKARYHFNRLGMDRTAQRNGVLIYLAVHDHAFAIFADKGIDVKVPVGFWRDVVNLMEVHFRKRDFVVGLRDGVRMVGEMLQEHFPLLEGDRNELPDVMSFEE